MDPAATLAFHNVDDSGNCDSALAILHLSYRFHTFFSYYVTTYFKLTIDLEFILSFSVVVTVVAIYWWIISIYYM